MDVARTRIARGGAALAGGPADVATGQVHHLVRPHGKTEVAHGGIDLVGRSAIFHQGIGRLAIHGQDAIADETIADPGAHRHLAQALGQFESGGHHIGGDLARHHDFQQLHHIGRREEMQADHVRRTGDAGGNRVDVEVGRVGRQHGTGFANAVQFGEDGLLHRQIFEDGFDHHIGGGQVFITGAALQARQYGVAGFLRETALGHLGVVNFFHMAASACERFVVTFNHGHRQTGIEHRHGNARTHGAAADHTDLFDAARLGVAGLGGFLHFAFGEEGVDQAGALRAVQALQEELAFQGESFLEGEIGGGFHRIDDLVRRKQPT